MAFIAFYKCVPYAAITPCIESCTAPLYNHGVCSCGLYGAYLPRQHQRTFKGREKSKIWPHMRRNIWRETAEQDLERNSIDDEEAALPVLFFFSMPMKNQVHHAFFFCSWLIKNQASSVQTTTAQINIERKYQRTCLTCIRGRNVQLNLGHLIKHWTSGACYFLEKRVLVKWPNSSAEG